MVKRDGRIRTAMECRSSRLGTDEGFGTDEDIKLIVEPGSNKNTFGYGAIDVW